MNVNGVSDRNRMRAVVTQMRSKELAVLTLQDTHVGEERAMEYEDDFPGLKILAACGEDGRNGVMILIDSAQVEFEGDLGEMNDWGVCEGRVLVAPIKSERESFVVGCVYAPANLQDRVAWNRALVTEARRNLSEHPRCDILTGDWNMIESREDSNSNRSTTQEDLEAQRAALYELMNQESDYVDGWRLYHPGERAYTHTNTAMLHRNDAGKSRIDRIYVRADWYLGTRYWMIVPLGISDHSMVRMDYCPSNPLFGKGRWRASAAMVGSTPMVAECQRIFVDGFRDITAKENRQLECTEILNTWGRVKERMKQSMRVVQIHQLRRVGSRKHTLRMKAQTSGRSKEEAEARLVELKEMEEDDRKDYCYNAMVKDYIVGERPNAYFYQKVKASHGKGSTIRELRGLDTEETTSDPNRMLEVVQGFYGGLYAPKASVADARQELLNNVDARVSADWKRKLELPFSGSEVRAAIGRGKLGRSPGEDGLPIDLYRNIASLKEEMVEILTTVLNAVRDARDLPAWFKRGCLTLLYKKGDPADIKNYRPLSIMGADYKLYTAILANRLVKALEMIIRDHQTAFLPGRLIGDNIKLVQCVIDRYKDSEEEVAVLFLDQEKAYDRVSHTYMWECMRHIGLPRRFINRIKALYSGGTLVPYMNGHKGDEIRVYSGVRQGDPLSCILYDLVMEPLAMTIMGSPALRGIELPNGRVVKVVLYADDTSAFPRGPRELQELARILGLFERAAGALINWVKSRLMALGTMRT